MFYENWFLFDSEIVCCDSFLYWIIHTYISKQLKTMIHCRLRYLLNIKTLQPVVLFFPYYIHPSTGQMFFFYCFACWTDLTMPVGGCCFTVKAHAFKPPSLEATWLITPWKWMVGRQSGWWFEKICLYFHPEFLAWRAYCSTGLVQPPTSNPFLLGWRRSGVNC